MDESGYKPIACGLHEHYQYAVMKRARLDLRWQEADGTVQAQRVMPLDVLTRAGAEYLTAECAERGVLEIRLDRIIEARWADNGCSLDPGPK